MDRLTRRNPRGTIGFEQPIFWYNYQDFQRVASRLASYEDTGLMPEDIEALKAQSNSLDFQNGCLESMVSSLGETVSALQSELEQVKAERDTAITDFKEYMNRNISGTHGVYACDFCKHSNDDYDCKKKPCNGLLKWQWRGMEGR